MERTVKAAMLTYRVSTGKNVAGQETYRIKHAFRGDTVDDSEMYDSELDRFERLGVFVGDADDESDEEAFNVAEASDVELADWIREDRPTIQQLLDATNGDPELAQRILEAEGAATGGDPRRGLVDGVAKIVGDSTQ